MITGSQLGLETQEDTNPPPSPPKDIRPGCQQRLLPFKENNPNHHNHNHNDHNDHNYNHNNHHNTSAKYKPDNESSDPTSAAHHHLSPSFNIHSSHCQVKLFLHPWLW